jgi:hypothetical protein
MELPAGPAAVGLARSWGSSFFGAETTFVVDIAEADTAWVMVSWAAPVYVDSDPQGAAVKLDGGSVGVTPLVMTGLAPGVHRFGVSHRCCLDSSFTMTLSPFQPRLVRLGLTRQAPGHEPDGAMSRLVPVAGAGLSLAAAVAAWVLHEEADRAYQAYLSTADPDRMQSKYSRARSLDRGAAALWAVSLSSFVSTILWAALTGGS